VPDPEDEGTVSFETSENSVTAQNALMLRTTAVIISYVAGGKSLVAMPQAK
jgi:hypothetical protein